jgi:hypothetical protein
MNKKELQTVLDALRQGSRNYVAYTKAIDILQNSDVNIPSSQRVGFDEIASWFDFITH